MTGEYQFVVEGQVLQTMGLPGASEKVLNKSQIPISFCLREKSGFVETKSERGPHEYGFSDFLLPCIEKRRGLEE